MWWDKNYQRPDFRGWLGGVDATSRSIVVNIAKNYESVLDCACGICLDWDRYQKENIKIQYTGLDACNGLVKEACERGINVVEGSIEKIPFKDSSFDIVTARHILEHLSDFKKALREMARVARHEVVVVFFLPPDKENIGTDPRLGSEVHLNTYSKAKVERLAKQLGSFEWIPVENEVILKIRVNKDKLE